MFLKFPVQSCFQGRAHDLCHMDQLQKEAVRQSTAGPRGEGPTQRTPLKVYALHVGLSINNPSSYFQMSKLWDFF